MSNHNIAIVWDFDGTLTPQDSTTEVVEFFNGKNSGIEFWSFIKSLTKRADIEEFLPAVDAPVWMYSLAQMANNLNTPLVSDFFRKDIIHRIQLYDNVVSFLRKIKKIEQDDRFKKCNLKIHHFIVSAGLRDLIQLLFPKDLITYTFGCRYEIISYKDDKNHLENIPVFCMDETVKTRALYEISKGAFCGNDIKVNTKILDNQYWSPFKNFIYIGDGDTDIPALSLTRSKGGLGIVVYNEKQSSEKIKNKLSMMSIDERADLITPANFSINKELYSYIKNRCYQILQRYEVSNKFN